MSEHQYFAANEKDEVEFKRLRLLEETYDPNTIRYMEKLGLKKGWDCLEIGAGAGSIANWLAAQVGPSGKVVATDIDTRLLRHLNAVNIEVRQHDILKDALEMNKYDLAHCRLLLMHLPEPEKALKRMVNAIRPGGWLLIEELDLSSELSIDTTNPSAASFVRTRQIIFDANQKKGTIDPFLGRRVRGLLEQSRLTDVNNEGWTYIGRGGNTPEAQLRRRTMQVTAKPLVTAGILTQEQYENTLRMYEDPSFYFLTATTFSAWGRKPAK
ncbi:MAG: methyltransferase domain-containing protein [Chloroflexota bacterium]